MEIEVWSDVVCPWCYIGRRRLQQALAQRGDLGDVTIRHRAFQLQPDAPKGEAVPTAEHLAAKYGVSPQEAQAMQDNVTAVARSVGLEYHLDQTLSGNTEDAHRLLLWAGDTGGQDELLERMYAAYFTEGRSLFGREELLEVVTEAGLDAAAAAVVLDSDQYRDSVGSDAALAGELGANGVPFFVFDMRYGIAGAQPLEVFTRTLDAASGGRTNQSSP